MTTVALEQLLAEVEDLLRTMPARSTIRHETPENYAWLGRAAAVVSAWDPVRAMTFDAFLLHIHAASAKDASQAVNGVITTLHRVRHDLRLKTVGPLSVPVAQGAVFDYFDELRKVIEEAKTDLLFVDPYLDAEFVSRYLPHVAPGVRIRLLGGAGRLPTLLPAVQLLRQQAGASVEVRTSPSLHDRFVFIDSSTCLQSGASFKDGAKKSPTTLTQITDAFPAMQATYEALWNGGIVRP